MNHRIPSRGLLASLLCLGFVQAQAQPFYAFEYESNEKRASHQTSMAVATTLGFTSDGGNEYSLKAGFSQPSLGQGELSKGVEAQAKLPFLATDRYTPYVALGLGEKIMPTDHFGFYFAGAGIKLPVTSASSADFGLLAADAFDPGRRLYTTRLHAALSYALTRSDSINLRAARSFGVSSEEKDSWRLMYTHSF